MNTNHYPSVSVVLPVYNAQDCLKACIESVLSQTLHDFELLVMDDGSTDNSMDIARSFVDERIHVIPCSHDFVNTLNRGICESRGKYIARMDADDLMMPNRLERQVGVMEADDSVAACFSHVITFGDMEKLHGSGNGIVRYPLIEMLRGNIFVHPTAMLRRSFLLSKGIRYHHYPYAEDYRMWVDICREGGRCYVVEDALLRYRVSYRQVTALHREEQEQTSMAIRQEILERLLAGNMYRKELLHRLYETMLDANEDGLLDGDQVFNTYYQIFMAITTNKQNAGIFLYN